MLKKRPAFTPFIIRKKKKITVALNKQQQLWFLHKPHSTTKPTSVKLGSASQQLDVLLDEGVIRKD